MRRHVCFSSRASSYPQARGDLALPHSAATYFLTGAIIGEQGSNLADRHASTAECIHRRLGYAGGQACPSRPPSRAAAVLLFQNILGPPTVMSHSACTTHHSRLLADTDPVPTSHTSVALGGAFSVPRDARGCPRRPSSVRMTSLTGHGPAGARESAFSSLAPADGDDRLRKSRHTKAVMPSGRRLGYLW